MQDIAMKGNGDDYLTVTETAAILRVSGAYVRRLLKEGRIRGSKHGPMWKIKKTEVREFQKKRR